MEISMESIISIHKHTYLFDKYGEYGDKYGEYHLLFISSTNLFINRATRANSDKLLHPKQLNI